jgi:hypothetical protein
LILRKIKQILFATITVFASIVVIDLALHAVAFGFPQVKKPGIHRKSEAS